MNTLAVRDSLFQDLFDFRRDFDQIFNRILIGKPWYEENPVLETAFNFTPAIESFVDTDGKKYFCRVSLPGVEPRDVEVNVQGNMLTIRGERKFTRNEKEVDLLFREMVYGKFERTLTLPEGVNVEKLVAEYKNGVLELWAPIAVAALPRKIEIKTVSMPKSIAA
jgi:HSP20 family protein